MQYRWNIGLINNWDRKLWVFDRYMQRHAEVDRELIPTFLDEIVLMIFMVDVKYFNKIYKQL